MREDIKERIEKIKRREVPNGYVNTDVGIIPSEWKVKKIKDAVVIRNDLRTPISEQDRDMMEGEFPYYGPTQVQDYIDCYTIEGPSVLIGEDGDHFLKYKDKEMTMYVDGKYSVNNHAHVIQYKSGCDIKWFMYVFQHRNLFNAITRQGAGRYKLTKDALSKLYMQIGPENEQKKIVEILEGFDEMIQLLNIEIESKNERNKWIIQNLISGKRRLTGFVEKWENVKLGKTILEHREKNKENKVVNVKSINNRLGFINQNEQFGKIVASNDLSNYKIVEKGDIAYNPSRINVGSIAIYEDDIQGIISPMYIVIKTSDKLLGKYLMYYVRINDFYQQMKAQLSGSVRDSLNFEDLCSIRIKLPSREEQESIVRALEIFDKEIKLLENKLKQTKLEKKAMMQLLLSGIVRVN